MFEQLPGLVASPRPIYLFVDLTKDDAGTVYPWHVYDHNARVAVNISKPALEGQLKSIRIRIKEFQNKQNYKIEFTMKCGDRTWIVRSGIETFFTRGVVLQLREIRGLEDFPTITLLAEAGDTTVRGSVWLGGEQVKAEWDEEVKLFNYITELQSRLGQEPQTVESIKADFAAETAPKN